MAQTYLELTQQIEELKHRAEAVREMEVAGVVERIKLAIEAYGLTVEQLFGSAGRPVATSASRVPSTGRPPRKGGSAPRFRDGSGNSWSGRGPRPGWVKAALATGRSLDEFAVTGASLPEGEQPAGKPQARPAKRPLMSPRYRDDSGHSWSGRGPRPGWLKLALDAGKTLDELSA